MEGIQLAIESYLGSGAVGIQGLFVSILIAYLGGMLASLTPCVYPMIPITVSAMGGMQQSKDGKESKKKKWKTLLLKASIYICGMALVYAFLGVLAGLTGRIFGTFTQTAEWSITLGVIMTLAALVMFDVVPFDPVSWWAKFKSFIGLGRKTGYTKNENSLPALFALGASSGLVAAPCTTPILTAILAYISRTQSIGIGMVLMLSFALGLGTLLMVIALSAGAISVLPKSGQWLQGVKIVSGFILLAFAHYLFYEAGVLGR